MEHIEGIITEVISNTEQVLWILDEVIEEKINDIIVSKTQIYKDGDDTFHVVMLIKGGLNLYKVFKEINGKLVRVS